MQYYDSYQNFFVSGFRRTEGSTMQNLTPLAGAYHSRALAINDARDAVGVSYQEITVGFRGTIWHADGTKTELPNRGGGSTYAYSINNAGLFVKEGISILDQFVLRAVVQGLAGLVLALVDLEACLASAVVSSHTTLSDVENCGISTFLTFVIYGVFSIVAPALVKEVPEARKLLKNLDAANML